jgi:hypothetical protein
MLEGIAIAMYAIGAQHAYVYIRGEFGRARGSSSRRIAEAEAANLLGKGVFGTDREVHVTVHRGAGAYICGEETGLLSSLEGGRGYPKIKPPFPAVEGAWGCPTIVNNVETLACLPGILTHGPEWFRSRGNEKSPGTKLFSLSGHVVRPGNYELPLGVPLKELIFDIAGGIPNGKKLKAVCPGGSSAPFLTAEEVMRDDPLIRLDFESLAAAGSMLGSGAIIVMDEDTCMVDAMWNVLRFYAHESCGQCTPCREGTGWIAKFAGRFERGTGEKSENRSARRGRVGHGRPHDLRARRRGRDAGPVDRAQVAVGVRGPRRGPRLRPAAPPPPAGRCPGWRACLRSRSTASRSRLRPANVCSRSFSESASRWTAAGQADERPGRRRALLLLAPGAPAGGQLPDVSRARCRPRASSRSPA